jgi:hypothetical protein
MVVIVVFAAVAFYVMNVWAWLAFMDYGYGLHYAGSKNPHIERKYIKRQKL